MLRATCAPRPDWPRLVEADGLIFHHTQDAVYWDESTYYQLTPAQVDVLESATNEVQKLCEQAAEEVISKDLFADFGIPPAAWPVIKSAWVMEPPALYGRFDFIYDGVNPPKLLEFNADTPTALLEAAVVQWNWKQSQHPEADQFNSIHERLVAKWDELRPYLGAVLYFAAMPDVQAEDLMTATYLRETAIEAQIDTASLIMSDIGWDGEKFVDLEDREIRSIFKLYPWEWMLREEFGPHVLQSYDRCQWIEPIWKMLWSNKALLPLLWKMFPDHPNLVPAYHQNETVRAVDFGATYVRKPKLGREGCNIQVGSLFGEGMVAETDGDYGEEGFVFQKFVEQTNPYHPVIGSWVVDGQAAGIGIRESDGLITTNTCRFVPHIVK